MFSQLYRCQQIIRNALNFSKQVRVIAMVQIVKVIEINYKNEATILNNLFIMNASC
jgi:hypothetical protein